MMGIEYPARIEGETLEEALFNAAEAGSGVGQLEISLFTLSFDVGKREITMNSFMNK